jgi:hypothetical protein
MDFGQHTWDAPYFEWNGNTFQHRTVNSKGDEGCVGVLLENITSQLLSETNASQIPSGSVLNRILTTGQMRAAVGGGFIDVSSQLYAAINRCGSNIYKKLPQEWREGMSNIVFILVGGGSQPFLYGDFFKREFSNAAGVFTLDGLATALFDKDDQIRADTLIALDPRESIVRGYCIHWQLINLGSMAVDCAVVKASDYAKVGA